MRNEGAKKFLAEVAQNPNEDPKARSSAQSALEMINQEYLRWTTRDVERMLGRSIWNR